MNKYTIHANSPQIQSLQYPITFQGNPLTFLGRKVYNGIRSSRLASVCELPTYFQEKFSGFSKKKPLGISWTLGTSKSLKGFGFEIFIFDTAASVKRYAIPNLHVLKPELLDRTAYGKEKKSGENEWEKERPKRREKLESSSMGQG